MLREIGPRVLLLHGKKVAEAFQARYRQTPTDTFTSMTIGGTANDCSRCPPSVQRFLALPLDRAW